MPRIFILRGYKWFLTGIRCSRLTGPQGLLRFLNDYYLSRERRYVVHKKKNKNKKGKREVEGRRVGEEEVNITVVILRTTHWMLDKEGKKGGAYYIHILLLATSIWANPFSHLHYPPPPLPRSLSPLEWILSCSLFSHSSLVLFSLFELLRALLLCMEYSGMMSWI